MHDVWLFDARSDTKVCPKCLAYDGQIFHGNHLRARFPHLQILDVGTIGGKGPDGTGLVHPNCRCQLLRVMSAPVPE